MIGNQKNREKWMASQQSVTYQHEIPKQLEKPEQAYCPERHWKDFQDTSFEKAKYI